MNAVQFLTNIDRLIDTPDAVPRLRQFILNLAVRGELVDQDPREEPASILLGDRQFVPRPGTEPWRLPPGWAWSNYRLIGETLGGGTPSKSSPDFWKGFIPWVSPKDMKVDQIRDAQDHISELAVEHSSVRLVPAGSLLMVVRGMILAHSFPIAIATVPVTINQDMKAIVPFRQDMGEILLLISKGVKPEVLRLVLRSSHGTCKLITDHLFSFPLPIPPLTEQHRILSKVDELMALCDRLEASLIERERRRDQLTAASLQRLNQPAADASAFREHACFYLRHLPRVTIRPAQIQQLRQTILNLAVQGRLVPQDPKDEPVTELLKLIQERSFHIKNNVNKKQSNSLPFASFPSPESNRSIFDIPTGWRWVQTKDLSSRISDGVHKKPDYLSEGVPFLTVRNLTQGPGISFRDTRFISEFDHFEFVKRTHPEKGDVLITKDGTIGVARVIETDRVFSIFVSVALVKMPVPQISPFIALCLNSKIIQSSMVRTGSALKHLHLVDLRKLPIPLPPLAEQHRIVAKVDELMTLCDRLEEQIIIKQNVDRISLEACLHQALNPAP